jgi:ADP-heptose:LPS heptosyltransferase
VNEEIMLRNRSIDEVLVFNKERYLRRWGLRIGNAVRDLKEIRARRFELAIVPSTVSTSLTSDFLGYLSGATIRMGARSLQGEENPSGFLFTHAVDLDWRDTPERHQTLRNADVMGEHSPAPEDLSHEITLEEGELNWARHQVNSWTKERTRIVGIHPGAGKRPNQWPATRFGELGRILMDEFGVFILVTAGPMDGEEVTIVETALGTRAQVVRNEPIRRVASLLKYAHLVISNDTGIMHVAAGVGTPVLSLFGPTDPRQWAPLGAIHRYIKSETSDISEIQVSHVVGIARGMLHAPATGQRSL